MKRHNSKSYRPCQLNLQTVRDRFPTPTVADLILFSKIDIMSGFHQLRIRDEHAHKTAFVVEDGPYEWVVCPFGLSSTPSCFQRLIFTKTDDPHEHLEKLEKVLDSIRQYDLSVKGSKCSLFRTELEFLSFWVSADDTRSTPSKVETVVRMSSPKTVSDRQRLLWSPRCEKAFRDLQSPLISTSVLR
jgi:hypothetical protein